MSDTGAHLTESILHLIYFRAQGDDGAWRSVNARDASDRQFDTWARERIPSGSAIASNQTWTLAERAAFCDMLWKENAISVWWGDHGYE